MATASVWRELAADFRAVSDDHKHPLTAIWESHPVARLPFADVRDGLPLNPARDGLPFNPVDLASVDFTAGVWSCVGADLFFEYAERASDHLGLSVGGRGPVDAWLDYLARSVPEHVVCDGNNGIDNHPDRAETIYTFSLTIPDVCGASARVCESLQTAANKAVVRESTDFIPRTFADVIEHVCKSSGLRVDEIATKCGVTESTVRKWRRGEMFPPIPKWKAVAETCGRSLAEIERLILNDRKRPKATANDRR